MHFSTFSVLATIAASVGSFSFLPGYSDDWIAIHQTLNTYPLAIDNKDFGLLSQVFTNDVVANYSTSIGVLRGLADVEEVLQQRSVSRT